VSLKKKVTNEKLRIRFGEIKRIAQKAKEKVRNNKERLRRRL
jgi:hypothetical protein